MTDKELIQKKREQIRALKLEIAELEDKTVGAYVKCDGVFRITEGSRIRDDGFYFRRSGTRSWQLITRLSTELFRYGLEKQDLGVLQKNLTKDQKKKAAAFCDEVIPIYNSYMAEIYPEFKVQGKW